MLTVGLTEQFALVVLSGAGLLHLCCCAHKKHLLLMRT